MLAQINPVALPALRIAATFFLILAVSRPDTFMVE
jgi:hypothetical protein